MTDPFRASMGDRVRVGTSAPSASRQELLQHPHPTTTALPTHQYVLLSMPATAAHASPQAMLMLSGGHVCAAPAAQPQRADALPTFPTGASEAGALSMLPAARTMPAVLPGPAHPASDAGDRHSIATSALVGHGALANTFGSSLASSQGRSLASQLQTCYTLPPAALAPRMEVACEQWDPTPRSGSHGNATASSVSGRTTSLYVKGLPPETDELFLFHVFAPHGALHSCKVKRDPSTGNCSGVAFVNYMHFASAMRAIAALDGAALTSGGQMHVTLQLPRAQRAANAAAYRAATSAAAVQPAASTGSMLLTQHLPSTQIGPDWPAPSVPSAVPAWYGGYALTPTAQTLDHRLASQSLALYSTW